MKAMLVLEAVLVPVSVSIAAAVWLMPSGAAGPTTAVAAVTSAMAAAVASSADSASDIGRGVVM